MGQVNREELGVRLTPTEGSEEDLYKQRVGSGIFARMNAGLQSNRTREEPGASGLLARCMYCRSLLDCPDAFQTPHQYLFHEGVSKSSATALRFSCLLCTTKLTWQQTGPNAGWK